MLATSFRYGLHPHLPIRLGYRALLNLINRPVARLLSQTEDYTLVPARSRVTIHRVATEVLEAKVPGDFVEIGVHRGGSAAMIADVVRRDPNRTLWLFDRWGDLPEPTEKDGHRQTEYARANIPEKLAKLADDMPLKETRHLLEDVLGFNGARYQQGWYDETFAEYAGDKIAFASIDCDYYESSVLALDFVARHASPGCRIVMDDYDTWPGARTATDEFAAKHGIRVDPTGLGTALLTLR